jgi:flagellar biosynthesis/type III secretory pathway M-ring protein FliF/YscJ
MPAFLSQFLSQLKNIWVQLNPSQRLNVGAVLLATVVGMGALVWFGSRPDYRAFSDYPEDEHTSVTQALERSGIEWKQGQGNVILINGSQYDDALKALASQGLTSASMGGKDNFDVSSMMGPTKVMDFILEQKRVGQITRDLRKMSGVSYASLHFHAGRSSRFLRGDKHNRSRASVMLAVRDVNRFRSIARDAVALVADALDIPHERVTVISKDGGQFNMDSGGGMGGGSHQDLMRLELERSELLTAASQFKLNEIFGQDMAKVTVHVTIDNKIQSSEEIMTPTEKLLKRESGSKEKSSNGTNSSLGDPGVGSTLSGAGLGGGSAGGSQNEMSNSTSDKEYMTEVGRKKVVQLSPDIKQISVGLAIDPSIQSQQAEIIDLIKGMIGWSSERDPAVTALVATMPKPETYVEESMDVGGIFALYGPMLAQVFSVILVLFFLRGVLKRTKVHTVSIERGHSEPEPEEMDPRREVKKLRKEIEKVVASDPGSVSRLLESWLMDSKVKS